jgi:hypothetical protein
VFRKFLLSAAATVTLLAVANSAAAKTIEVINVGVTSNDSAFDHLNLTALGNGGHFGTSEWAPGILFTEKTAVPGVNTTELVFCIDLEHVIYVTSYNPALDFTTGLVEFTGAGVAISAPISNEIGQLADFGRSLYATQATDYAQQLVAVQGAIWSLEYGVGGARATSTNATIDDQIVQLLKVQDNGRGLANALISHAPGATLGAQNMTTGSVPEPASWALMIGGFGMAGAALRRKRSAAATA